MRLFNMSDCLAKIASNGLGRDVSSEPGTPQAPRVATPATIASATHSEGTGRKRGPVPKRRYQTGCFRVENGKAYTIFYRDVQSPDGTLRTQRARHCHGDLSSMSKREARRRHDLFMNNINRQRGCVPTTIKTQTFRRAVDAWRHAVAPQLSPATVRQRESYLRTHILPRFGDVAPDLLDIPTIQEFATELQQAVAPKTVINVLGTIFAILRYAKKCRIRIADVSFKELTLKDAESSGRPYFTSEQASRIIAAAREPYKTMFALAATTGPRAGELLALTVSDLDFRRNTICVSKSADDNTRIIRKPKTKKSVALLPMPSELAETMCGYLQYHWKDNEKQLLFPNRKGSHPRWRDNVVKYGLKPILRKLNIPEHNAGLHAFRHGLATELAESEPITVLQTQMRHADVRTTLSVYAHVIPDSQRESMERIANRTIGKIALENARTRINTGESAPIGTNVPIGTRNGL
jgi:integrase